MKKFLTINYLGAKTRGLDAECTIYIGIPEAKAGVLVGKGGEMFRSIGREFSVGLQMDNNARDPEGNPILKITGALAACTPRTPAFFIASSSKSLIGGCGKLVRHKLLKLPMCSLELLQSQPQLWQNQHLS